MWKVAIIVLDVAEVEEVEDRDDLMGKAPSFVRDQIDSWAILDHRMHDLDVVWADLVAD